MPSEKQIDELRLKAFKTNDPAEKAQESQQAAEPSTGEKE